MTSLLVRLAGVAGLSSLLVGLGPGTIHRAGGPESALATFGERTAAYAVLHRRVERQLPALEAAETLRSLLGTRAKLAKAIKAARPDAQQGEIFTPAVTEVFRVIISKALSGVDSEAFLRDLYEEQELMPGFLPRVHDAYPEWATHEVPVIVLERLPLLPEELEYRLIDRALVLWDVDADLIIDVLLDAIPGPTS
jgi:hypothetical protein